MRAKHTHDDDDDADDDAEAKDPLSELLICLAHKVRLDIVKLLARYPEGLTVAAIINTLQKPQPTISMRLAHLRNLGLVSFVQVGQQHMYTLNRGGFRILKQFADRLLEE